MNLYWNSILPFSLPRLFIKFLAVSIWSFESLNLSVANSLSSILGNSSYYLFTSARGSLAFFFKTFLNPGDEVLLTGYTCLAVPTACLFANIKPIYIDVNKDLSLDIKAIQDSLSIRTKCIVVQHTLGGFSLSQELIDFCISRNLYLVEDCSLAMGSTFNNLPFGSFGDAAIYSFELSKILSSGWGGALRINNPNLTLTSSTHYREISLYPFLFSIKDFLQTFVCSLQSHHLPNNKPFAYFVSLLYKCGLFRLSTPLSELKGSYDHHFLSRMPAAQLTLLDFQLKRAPLIFQSCHDNFKIISTILRSKGFFVHAYNQSNVFVVTNRVLFYSYDRSELVKFFQNFNIEIGSWFDSPVSPIPSSPKFNYHEINLPNSLKYSSMSVNLPCHSLISKSNLLLITDSLSLI